MTKRVVVLGAGESGAGAAVLAKLKGFDVDEGQIQRNKAIIQSMTKKERLHPEIIKASQRKRIATGSGTTIQDVNTLLKQFEQSKEMIKQMKNKKGFKNMFG